MADKSNLPAPKDAFIAVLNYLALAVFMGQIEVAVFDQASNALIAVTDGELQAELFQIQLLVRRGIVDVE